MNVDWKLGTGRLTSTTRLALLGLESVERPRLHRPAGDDDLGGAVEAAAVDAGGPLRRRSRAAPQLRRRRLRLPPDDRLGSVVQAGAGRGRGALSAGAERRRGDARPPRRLRLSTSTSTYRQRQRGGVRPARVVGHRSPAPACPASGSTTTRRTSTSISRSTAACRPTNPALIALQRSILAPQAYKADVDDTNLSGQMTVAYKVAGARQRLCDLCDRLQVGRPQPERRAHRRAGPAGPLRRDRQARRRAPLRGRDQDRAASPASPRTSRSTTPRSRTSRRRSSTPASACFAATSPTPRRCACAAPSSTAAPASSANLSFYGAAAYTDGKYVSFPDAPPPLEDTGGPQVEGHLGLGPARHLEVGALRRRRIRPSRHALRPRRRVLRRARHQLSLVVLVERQRLAATWWSTATRLLNARVGFRWADGWTRHRSGRATCWTRTTSSCSRRRPATPASTSASPGMAGPWD